MTCRIVLVVLAGFLFTSLAVADDGPALAALEKAGAAVQRDDSQKGRPVTLITCFLRQTSVEVLRALKEIEELPAIEFIGSGDTEITPAMLRAVQGKWALKRLTISFAKIPDESAKVLATMKHLESLNLQKQIEINPEGMNEIFRLSSLKELTISGRMVSDDSVKNLTKMAGLRVLSLESAFVSDQWLSSLKRLKNLRTLRIYVGSSVTHEGIRQLAELNLIDLEITFLSVTNDKLKELRTLSGLKALRMISAASVTDDAIPTLAELKELQELDLSDASLTVQGIRELKRSLPSCRVAYDARQRK